jgi:hypothetical protein
MAWLGIKYVPLAVVVALPFLLDASWRARAGFLGLSGASAVVYVWFHYAVFGDLTPYSVNTVYEGAPALDVLQAHVSVQDRVYRIWGLFIDQRFGIGRWAPVLLLVPFALPLLRRGALEVTACALIIVQLLIATFVAITMMGWWFPGRTLVTVLPLFALALASLLRRYDGRLRAVASFLAVYSAGITASLWHAVTHEGIRLAVDPFDMRAPLFQAVEWLFPNYTSWSVHTTVVTAGWLALAACVFAVVAWRELKAKRRPGLDAVLRLLSPNAPKVASSYD